MAINTMQDFTFKHSDQLDALYTQYTASQIKALFDSRGTELRTALNLLITTLKSTEGATDVGTSTIQDVDGANIQAMLQSIRDKLKSVADGTSGADYVNATAITGLTGTTIQTLLESLKTYTDTYNTNHKLSTSTDHDNRYYTETEINSKVSDLSGSGRTTETIKKNADDIANHKISTDHDTRYFTKDQLQSITDGSSGADNIKATPISANSGNTVQSQLEWLLTQIAVAATGTIPDGSITEVKLAQALITKIDTALSNTGVLTTLLTTDKSSLVNALNEVLTNFNTHKNSTSIHVTKDNVLQTGLNADEIDGCHAGIVANNVFKIPSNITSGDIFYVDANGQILRLQKGSNGQYLGLNNGLPSWINIQHSIEPIQIIPISNTTTSEVIFNNIPNKYKHLKGIIKAKSNGSLGPINMYVNDVNNIVQQNITINYSIYGYYTGSEYRVGMQSAGNPYLYSTRYTTIDFIIYDYNDTDSKNMSYNSMQLPTDGMNTSSYNPVFGSTCIANNNSVKSIKFTFSNVFAQNSYFELYGIY